MIPQAHEFRGHAELSPSSSSRWMACPGSVLLSRGIPNTSSPYADEGTAAHELAEVCINSGTDPENHIGRRIEVRGREWEVTLEMAGNVAVYVDHVRSLQADAGVGGLVEHRFTLAALEPPAPMHGTADFVLHDKKKRILYVSDLKYGQGVAVQVYNNSQLKYYALGALVSLGLQAHVDEVRMTIVQPRMEHPDGPVRSETVRTDELTDFAMDLLAAATEALKPNQPLVSGKHCKFCRAHAVCPQVAADALQVAGEAFDFEVAGAGLVQIEKPLALPDVKALTVEQVASYLPKLDLLEDWIRALRQYAHAELEAGREVPGYKLVNKRANRTWAVTPEDVIKLARKFKLKKDQLFDTPSLLSPAKLEKLFKFPDSFTQQISSGTTMAPSSDKRQAINPVKSLEQFDYDLDDPNDFI